MSSAPCLIEEWFDPVVPLAGIVRVWGYAEEEQGKPSSKEGGCVERLEIGVILKLVVCQLGIFFRSGDVAGVVDGVWVCLVHGISIGLVVVLICGGDARAQKCRDLGVDHGMDGAVGLLSDQSSEDSERIRIGDLAGNVPVFILL